MTLLQASRAKTYNDGEWRLDAACASGGTEAFFPVGHTGAAIGQTALAKRVCASCPVRLQCLEFAVTTNQEYGVWGGADEEERRNIRRRWRRYGQISA
ncbi:MAG: WhiB family transcriptional regulator WhcE [Acidimicrobiales bacterium]